ncbi:MAG: endo-1,4-beta-xylanase [Clostridiales bacterium]|nr:endo-1,4-beta-xylanase [Clostridiales bacterium]
MPASRKLYLKRFIAAFTSVLLVFTIIPSGYGAGLVHAAEQAVYSEDFSSEGSLNNVQNAGATLEWVESRSFDSLEVDGAVYVKDRAANKEWNGVDVPFQKFLSEPQDGDVYNISAIIYIDSADVPAEGFPSGAQICIQPVDSYSWPGIAVAMTTGSALQLSGTYTYDETSSDRAFRIKGNNDSVGISFYVGGIAVSKESGGDEAPIETETVFSEDFSSEESISGYHIQPAGATLEWVESASFGSLQIEGAAYVTDREENKTWNGLDIQFEKFASAPKQGDVYNISATVYIDDADIPAEGIPSGAQFCIQPVDSYSWLGISANMESGKAIQLSGAYTYDESSSDRGFRIKTLDDTLGISFYVDSIVITKESDGEEEPSEPEEPTDKDVYTDSTVILEFEEQADMDKISAAGGAGSLSQASGKVFAGNSDGFSAYIEGRSDNWNGIDIMFSSLGLKKGDEILSLTVNGFLDADAVAEAGQKVAVQSIESYRGYLGDAEVSPGGAFTISNVLEPPYEAGSNNDVGLRIQTTAGLFPFYIGNISFEVRKYGEGSSEPDEFKKIDFEDGTTQGFSGRGGNESLSVTDEENHTEGGRNALKVEGRAQTWNGPSLNVTSFIEEGCNYQITAWVKLISPASTQLQLSTQVGSGGSANYVNLEGKSISAEDGWVQYQGTYRYSNMSSGYATIYVESGSDGTASFYIDDINFEKIGGPIELEEELTPIKDVYEGDFLIGNAVSMEDLDGVRLALLKDHFNIVTAGNAMKPDALQGSPGAFTFEGADALVQKAIDNGFLVHGHTLAWHQQSGFWLNTEVGEDGRTLTDENGLPIYLDRESALSNLTTHAYEVVKHFSETFNTEEKQNIISWDVVNEAMNDNPANPSDWQSALRSTAWLGSVGPDYIEEAFLAARRADPSIMLYYNDYNLDNQQKADAVCAMVQDINSRYPDVEGRPLIDGVGMQGHYRLGINPANVEASLEKFISLGVEVSITELDIQAGSNGVLSDQAAESQAYLYAQLFQIFKSHAADIARVTFWGMDDGTSWRASSTPNLFSADLQAKPAYYAVIDPDAYIAGHDELAVGEKTSSALYGSPEIDGLADSLWADAQEIPVDQYQMAWQGATGIAKALWDDENLYVLASVSDEQLDKASPNAYEQDSVEVFVDEDNAKSTAYQDDDGQFRVSFDNEPSFDHGHGEGFLSATEVSGTNYTVEMKIPFRAIAPENGKQIGFDVSINDAKGGSRQSVAAWSDLFGTAYTDPSVFGTLTLIGKPEAAPEPSPEPSPAPPTSTPAPEAPISSSDSSPSAYVPVTVTSYDDHTDLSISCLGASNADGVFTVLVPSYATDALLARLAGLDASDGPFSASIAVKADKASDEAHARISWTGIKSLIANGAFSSISIAFDTIEVKFDKVAVEAILSASSGQTIDIAAAKVGFPELDSVSAAKLGGRPAYNISIHNGDTAAADFNGGLMTLKIPYALGENEDPDSILGYYVEGGKELKPLRSVYQGGRVSMSSFHLSSFAVGFNPVSFKDVSSAAYYADAAQYLGARGIVSGELFNPNQAATRGETIVMLMKAYGIEPLESATDNFSDAAGPFAGYYAQAKKLGLSAGIGNNLIGADIALNRETLFTLVYNILNKLDELPAIKEPVKKASDFSDYSEFSEWSKDSINWLTEAGKLVGDGARFMPKSISERAQISAVLHRLQTGIALD